MIPKQDVNVKRLTMWETGTYVDQELRPYTPNLTMEVLNQINHQTHGGQNLSVTALASVAGNIIRPAAQSTGVAQIVNGWNTRRFAFIMELEFVQLGTVMRQILTGYTSHSDLSHGGEVAPDMTLHFNSSMVLHTSRQLSANGAVNVVSMRDAAHIVTDTGIGQSHQARLHQPRAVTMRPEDVFSRMGASHLLQDQANGAMDTRTDFTLGAKKSFRSNTSAPVYLSKTLGAYTNAIRNADIHEDDANGIADSATGTVKEQDIAADIFLRSFISEGSEFRESGSITWEHLCFTNPHVNSITEIFRSGPVTKENFREDSVGFNGCDNETLVATILSQSVPAIMLDLMLTTLVFEAHNGTMDSGYAVRILGECRSFADGIDPTPYVERFIYRLRTEVLPDISHNNNLSFNLIMNVNVIGDTVIDISIEGSPMAHFIVPSFCDALMVPVLSNSGETLGNLAGDLESLCSNFEITHNGV